MRLHREKGELVKAFIKKDMGLEGKDRKSSRIPAKIPKRDFAYHQFCILVGNILVNLIYTNLEKFLSL